MENNEYYHYIKLFVENFPFWALIGCVSIWLFVRNPDVIQRISPYISKFKIGAFELEFRQLQAQLAETSHQVKVLKNDLERESARFNELLESFDPHAPVSELAKAREALKLMASGIQDLSAVRKGLAVGASAREIYAAAEVARERRDIALFDDIVSCLDRISRSITLSGVRLYTVWTLTSALHRTLIANIKHTEAPNLSKQQLETARSMLDRLVRNPLIIADRPDSPMQGVRGPAKWANDWIEKGIAKADHDLK